MKFDSDHDAANTPSAQKPASKIIRDKAFAKRIEQSTENHPHAPSGHGRQKWVKDQLEVKFNENVSAEAVRKWFAGEARPKPKMMALVARALNVDEAWLSLGITPTGTPLEKRKQNALVAGAVNLVAAQIQLMGGNIAYPDTTDEFDIFAIIKGKQHNITVRLTGIETASVIHLPLHVQEVIVVVPTDRPTIFSFFRVPTDVIGEAGNVRGNYTEMACELVSGKLLIGDRAVPEILSFDNLEGAVHNRKVA
jgi:hypothetical protein